MMTFDKPPSKHSAFWVQWMLQASPAEIDAYNRRVTIRALIVAAIFLVMSVAAMVVPMVVASHG